MGSSRLRNRKLSAGSSRADQTDSAADDCPEERPKVETFQGPFRKHVTHHVVEKVARCSSGTDGFSLGKNCLAVELSDH